MSAKGTPKQLQDLTVADLRESPVWRYEAIYDSTKVDQFGNPGGPVLELVERTDLRALDGHGPSTHVVFTRFVTANGAVLFGSCSPTEPSGLDYTQPMIITPSGPIKLWFEKQPDETVLAEAHAKLAHEAGSSVAEVFPIAVESLVPVGGTFYRAVAKRFDWLTAPRR